MARQAGNAMMVIKMTDPEILSQIISTEVRLNPVEPGIYSIYPMGHAPGAYDRTGASTIYDVVACNGLYNRLMWGYAIRDYATLCENSLAASAEGWVLDLACGSLAFTAEVYARPCNRPTVFVDQSLKLLRKARSRLAQLMGELPDNMYFLHADALRLPFNAHVFRTVISLNLLHCLCLADMKTALKEIRRVLVAGGNSAITTLVRSRRWSDRYLNLLDGSGALVARSSDELLSAFEELEMPVTCGISGNLAFVRHG